MLFWVLFVRSVVVLVFMFGAWVLSSVWVYVELFVCGCLVL